MLTGQRNSCLRRTWPSLRKQISTHYLPISRRLSIRCRRREGRAVCSRIPSNPPHAAMFVCICVASPLLPRELLIFPPFSPGGGGFYSPSRLGELDSTCARSLAFGLAGGGGIDTAGCRARGRTRMKREDGGGGIIRHTNEMGRKRGSRQGRSSPPAHSHLFRIDGRWMG